MLYLVQPIPHLAQQGTQLQLLRIQFNFDLSFFCLLLLGHVAPSDTDFDSQVELARGPDELVARS